MVVGVLEVTLVLYETASLKEKRSAVRRVLGRVRNKFNASAAEVDDLDAHDHAVLGITVVGNDRRFVSRVLDTIENFIDGLGIAELYGSQKAIETF